LSPSHRDQQLLIASHDCGGAADPKTDASVSSPVK
jgi:hypothetical protein